MKNVMQEVQMQIDNESLKLQNMLFGSGLI